MAADKRIFDLAVVGAGPAGLAAATAAARNGASVVLVDENPEPGGQIYRGVERASASRRRILGPDYERGLALVGAFRASGADYRPLTAVWMVTPDLEIGLSSGGTASLVTARHLVLATGAMERPFPIPGWTLPGVMTAGAAQILMKTSGLVADGAVLAGTGPLLWLLAAQYLAAGARIGAVLDTTPPGALRKAIRSLPAFLASDYLGKGLGLLASVRRRVRVFRHVGALRAEGQERVGRVVFRCGDGADQSIETEHLFLHQGVLPNINLIDATGCRQAWDPVQLGWRPAVDGWGRSSVDNISIAGDGAGVAGALAAELSGRLAGLDALHRLGRSSEAERDSAAQPVRRALKRARRGRSFLDGFYRPADAFRLPEGETLACRCEEVTADEVRAAAAMGCTGPNQAKAFLRCGMGPCQGRCCGTTLTELIATVRGASPAATGGLHLRPPVKPITLGELASMTPTNADIKAVIRL